MLDKASLIGPRHARMGRGRCSGAGHRRARVLLGLPSLAEKHAGEALEKACETALVRRFRLRTLRQCSSVKRRRHRRLLPFLDEHPIIRPLVDYAQVVARAIHRRRQSPLRGRRFYKAWLGRSSGPENTTALTARTARAVRRLRRALDPVIPRQVAPQQSPAPFHRTIPA